MSDTNHQPGATAHSRQAITERLLQTPPFTRLAVTHAFSIAGDVLITLSMAGTLFFAAPDDEARGRVALSLLLTMAPFAVVAPFLGPRIDRFRGGRRLVLILTAAARVALCIAMAQVVDRNDLLLYPLLFVTLVVSKTYSVVKSSLVPATVQTHLDLVRANSRLALTSAIVSTVAVIPGGIIYKLFGADWVFRIAALMFVVAAVMATRVVDTRPTREERAEAASVTLRSTGVIVAGVPMAAMRFVVGFTAMLVAFTFREEDLAGLWYALALGASAGGTLVGNVLGLRIRDHAKEEWVLKGSLLIAAACSLLMAIVANNGAAVAEALIVAITASIARLSFDAIVQRDAPDSARSRFFARMEATFQVSWVLGALIPVAVAIPLALGFFGNFAVAAAGLAIYIAAYWHLHARFKRGEHIEPTLAGAFPVIGSMQRSVGGAVRESSNRRKARKVERRDMRNAERAVGDVPESVNVWVNTDNLVEGEQQQLWPTPDEQATHNAADEETASGNKPIGGDEAGPET